MDSLVLRARGAAFALSPATNTPWHNFTNVVVVYLLLTRSLKLFRHFRARGIIQSGRDFYRWVLRVRPSLPPARAQHADLNCTQLRTCTPTGVYPARASLPDRQEEGR